MAKKAILRLRYPIEKKQVTNWADMEEVTTEVSNHLILKNDSNVIFHFQIVKYTSSVSTNILILAMLWCYASTDIETCIL